MKEDIKVSIVVPVYNVEKYLNQCVDSVLAQTYKNIEVILVDDGATDSSPAICDEYAEKDSRVKVVHKINEGQAFARVAGIGVASGDYVTLVDSDDWIDEDTIEKCVETVVQNPNLGCVIFSYKKERKNGNYVRHLFDGDKKFLTKQDFEDNIYCRLFGLTNEKLGNPESLEYLTSCCMKLYRRDLLNKTRCIDINEVGSGEDGIFGIYALRNCESAVYIDKPFYHYRANESSTTSTFRPKLVTQWWRLFSIMQEYIDENSLPSQYQEALNNRIALGILGIGLNGLCSDEMSFSEYKKYVNSYIKSETYISAIKTMNLKNLPFTWRVMLFCCKHRMSFSVCLILKVIKYLKSKM